MGKERERQEEDLDLEELEEEGGEKVVDRKTTSIVNAQNIVEDSKEERAKGEKDG
jgi:hypothetical protein